MLQKAFAKQASLRIDTTHFADLTYRRRLQNEGGSLSSTLSGAAKSIARTCAVCGSLYLQSAGHACPLGGSCAKDEDGLEGATIDDRYRIDKMLSKGGMGMVYKATHVVLDKPLAFKVMLQPQDEAARQRFLQEAKLAVQVRHRNIVDVVDFGLLSTNHPFLVMEFLVGKTLQEVIEKGPIPPARTCFLGAQVACGLSEVHRKGIIHRDLKPANIFVVQQGDAEVVKVVDFGIATQANTGQGGARLTAPGMVLGTAEYMAPEQAQGLPVDHRLDQYALGCILWEMLTGKVPFDGGHPTATMLKHLTDRAKAPSEVVPHLRIPPDLDQIVLRAMAKDPKDRFSSMAKLEEALATQFGSLKQRSPSTADLQLVRLVPPQNLRNRLVAVGSLATVLLLGSGLMVRWILSKPQSSVQARVVSQGGSVVHWRVATEPTGAEVIRVADGHKLGMTPWQADETQSGEPLLIELRKSGFVSKQVKLSRKADEERAEVLVPQPRRDRDRDSKSSTKKSGRKHKTRDNDQVIVVD